MGRELKHKSWNNNYQIGKRAMEEKKYRFIFIIYPPYFHTESLNVFSNKD